MSVCTVGTVEAAASCHVVDGAVDGEVDRGGRVRSIVFSELGIGEDDGAVLGGVRVVFGEG